MKTLEESYGAMKVISDLDGAIICFGSAVKNYDLLFSNIGASIFEEEYTFMEPQAFEDLCKSPSGLIQGPKTYWIEILMRAHLASVAAIIRTSRWMDVVTREYAAGNFYGWASGCRSFMESSGDNKHSLAVVPLMLAENYKTIMRALDGKEVDAITISRELEDILIHFTHARKVIKSDNAPQSHKAEQSCQYIKSLTDMGIVGAKDLYSELCSFVHPADNSVWILFGSNDGRISFNKSCERENLVNYSKQNRLILGQILQAAFNPAVLTLKMLQKFKAFKNVKGLRTTGLEHLPLWQQIEKHF